MGDFLFALLVYVLKFGFGFVVGKVLGRWMFR